MRFIRIMYVIRSTVIQKLIRITYKLCYIIQNVYFKVNTHFLNIINVFKSIF